MAALRSASKLAWLLGMLHDIGKIGIPDHILLKPSQLDETEWGVMKMHSEIGEKIMIEDLQLEIISKDRQRVDKILISRPASSSIT